MDPDALPKPKQVVLVYRFDFPNTKKIQFHLVFRSDDETSKEHLAKTTSVRDEFMASLEQGDPQLVLVAAEKYLPYLFGLVVSVEQNQKLRLNQPLGFSWCSGLSNKSKFYAIYTYRYELLMTLVSYALAHVNRACDFVLGTTDANLDENTKKAAHFLQTGAGIFEYIHSRELPRWVDVPTERPLELSSQVLKSMQEYCIACAQCLTIRKGLAGGTAKQVLAKLAVDVWRKYDDVHETFKKLPSQAYKDFPTIFKSFMSLSQGLAKASVYRYLGDNARALDQYGIATAYLTIGADALKKVWVPSPGTLLDRYAKEIEEAKRDIEHVRRTYDNENNHVYYQKVPEESALEIPEAKCLVTATFWTPPKPAFEGLR